MKGLVLLFLLSGCATPEVTVNKNVTIVIGDMERGDETVFLPGVFPIWITVEYTTKSDLDTDLKVEQQIQPEATIPLPGL